MKPSESHPLPTIPGVQINNLIGKGGMGKVYHGKQTYLGRNVAIKVIYSNAKIDPDESDKRFQREAKLLADMSQPNIVACYDGGITNEGQYFLIMEYIGGPDLGRLIRKHGALSEKTSIRIIRDISQALDHALQKGIIHRDVKAENILLQKINSPEENDTFPYVVKLADLGLARYQEQSDPKEQLTQQGSFFGTPQIMAPEQFQDNFAIDYRVDIYALGCLLYQCLHGRTPFESGNFSAIVAKKVTGELPEIEAAKFKLQPETTFLIQKLMSFDPEKRPGSYQEIEAECNLILAKDDKNIEPVPRRHITTQDTVTVLHENIIPVSGPKPGQSSGYPIGKMFLILLFLGLVSIGGFWWNKQLERTKTPVQNPGVATQPTGAKIKSLEPVVFSETGIPLFSEDYLTRLQNWEKHGSWGPEDEGSGVIAVTGKELAFLRYPVSSQKQSKWSGSVRLMSAIEAGPGISLDSGETYILRIQSLGSQTLCTLAELKDQEPGQQAILSPYGEKNILIESDPSITDVDFVLELNAEYLIFSINGVEIDRVRTTSSNNAFLLFNEEGTSRYREIKTYQQE